MCALHPNVGSDTTPGSSHPMSQWSAIYWAAPKELGDRHHIDKLDDSGVVAPSHCTCGVRSLNIQRVMVRPASSERCDKNHDCHEPVGTRIWYLSKIATYN